MKKLAIVVLIVLTACHRKVSVTSAPTATVDGNAGAATPREAVQKFMATGKAQDLQAMSEIWGSESGPARANMDKEVLEMRLIYMMRCLRHDSYTILGETTLAGGDKQFQVQVKRGTLAPTTSFTTTPGPKGRWFLKQFEPEPLNTICTSK